MEAGKVRIDSTELYGRTYKTVPLFKAVYGDIDSKSYTVYIFYQHPLDFCESPIDIVVLLFYYSYIN